MKNALLDLLARNLARPSVVDWLINKAMQTPYSDIVKDGDVYMRRYWLFNAYPNTGASGSDRKPWRFPLSIRLHQILLPDQDRELHDHPWNARTFILRGSYQEIRPCFGADLLSKYGIPEPDGAIIVRQSGTTAALKFGEYHRIISISRGGVWTLFVTGKYRGTWGFRVNGEKVQWREYLGLDKSQ